MSSIYDPGKGTRKKAKQAAGNIGFDNVASRGGFFGDASFSRNGGLNLSGGGMQPLQQALMGSALGYLGQQTGGGGMGGYGSYPQPFGGQVGASQFIPPWMRSAAQGSLGDLRSPQMTGGSPGYGWQPGQVGGPQMQALQQFRGMQAQGPSGQFNLGNMFSPQGAGPQQFGATPYGQQGQFNAPSMMNLFGGQRTNQFDPNQQALQQVQQQAIGTLGQTAEQLGGAQLDIMRQLSAQPEAQARQGLEQQLFSQGRLGTTGGGVQTQALNEAQSRADLERQLAAMQAGRDVRGQALTQLGTVGQEARGGAELIEGLNQGQFGRGLRANEQAFGQAGQGFQLNQQAQMDAFNRNLGVNQFNQQAQNQGFGQALDAYSANQAERQQQFQQQLLGSEFGQRELQNMFSRNFDTSQLGINTGFGNVDRYQTALQNQFGREFDQQGASRQRALDRFGIAESLFGAGLQGGGFGLDQYNAGLQGQQLGLQQQQLNQLGLQNVLGGFGQLQDLQLNPFKAALQAQTGASNAYTNQAGQYGQIAAQTPSLAGALGGPLQAISGGAFGGLGGIASGIMGAFGGGSKPMPPSYGGGGFGGGYNPFASMNFGV